MKSRSQALKEKRAQKPNAETRTVPLSFADPGAEYTCPECSAAGAAADCTERADGFAECPSCGSPVELKKRKDAVDRVIEKHAEKKAANPDMQKLLDEKQAKAPKRPPPMFCGECGEELAWETVGLSTFLYRCGHTKEGAGMVDDPKKARGKASAPTEPKPVAFGPGPVTVSGNRISIPWGEARMPIDQWNNFKCGGHIITVEVPPGEDRVAVAAKIIEDLERIADLLFRSQKAWYEKKLGILAGDTK